MGEVNRIKPALVGGLIAGVLSLVLSLVPVAGLGCCLWALLGGALATMMLVKSSPQPVKSTDGAKIGLLAGFVGGLLYFVIGTPVLIYRLPGMIEVMSTDSRVPVKYQEVYAQLLGNRPLIFVICVMITLIVALIILGFSALGGMLGVAIFEKRKGSDNPPPYPLQYPPQPPSNYPPQGGPESDGNEPGGPGISS